MLDPHDELDLDDAFALGDDRCALTPSFNFLTVDCNSPQCICLKKTQI